MNHDVSTRCLTSPASGLGWSRALAAHGSQMTNESWASSDATRRSMKGNRRTDTGPEMALRRRLHSGGYRYRVDYPALPGVRRRVDIAFTRQHVAVQVHGCYWHGCPIHYTAPKSNAEFWNLKVTRNRERDAETERLLQEAGWTVLTVWEHEDPDEAVTRVTQSLRHSKAGD